MWSQPRAAAGAPIAAAVIERRPCCQTPCGLISGVLLLLYAGANVSLYRRFTPVYRQTVCGDQVAILDNFAMGDIIQVGLQIQVSCFNPNAYAVQVMQSTPGRVYVGKDREVCVGTLSLVEGSSLPAGASGDIRVHMDAELAQQTSRALLPHLMSDPVVPMFIELQFTVGVGLQIWFQYLGTSQPFVKKCGMNMAGVLVGTPMGVARLGPMICRDTFEQISRELPTVGEAEDGSMRFSSGQMDPERIAMGEKAKDVSIIGFGTAAFLGGVTCLYVWCTANCPCLRKHPASATDLAATRQLYGPLSAANGHPSCMRATSGNLTEEELLALGVRAASPGAMSALLGMTPYRGPRHLELHPKDAPPPYVCFFGPMVNFLSCGTVSLARRGAAAADAPVQPQPRFNQSCMRATSGNFAEMAGHHLAARPNCMRAASGNLLEAEAGGQPYYLAGHPSCMRAASGNLIEAEPPRSRLWA